jgi:hypothetical protein
MLDERKEIEPAEPLAISPDMLAKIEEIESTEKSQRKTWTAEEDAILRAYWPVKNKEKIAGLLGVSYNTALTRYRKIAVD